MEQFLTTAPSLFITTGEFSVLPGPITTTCNMIKTTQVLFLNVVVSIK